MIIGRDALKGTIEESVIFDAKSLENINDDEAPISDYEGNERKLKKQGKDFIVFYEGEYHKAEISESYEGYKELKFTVQFDIEKEFLSKLEQEYYKRCAKEKTLVADELAARGMIREYAGLNEKSFNPLLLGAFKGKSSYLHFAANSMHSAELNKFISSIPKYIRKSYLKLKNRKGQKLTDLVTPDRAAIIRSYLEDSNTNNLENYDQNAHTDSINNSVDESMVRLVKNILPNEISVLDEGRTVKINHEKLKSFVKNQINKLQRELNNLRLLTNEDFFKSYIKPTLAAFEQKDLENNLSKKEKLIAYKMFQIEKAKDLMDDVINHGHIGDKTVNVDEETGNGLSIREMMAISYNASKDTNKLIRLGRPYYNLDKEEQRSCILEAQMKFIEGLYSIRRGYNLDHGTDDKDKMFFSRDAKDENVCPGGTVNRLGDALNGIHAEVEVRAVNTAAIKKKIQDLLILEINAYIKQKENDVNLAMQLREWKIAQRMPLELQKVVLDKARELLKIDHPLIIELAKDYSYKEISGNIARQAIEEYKYPADKILKSEVKVEQNQEDILEYYKTHVYALDEKGNYALNIDIEIRRNPSFIKTLLDNNFDLSNLYISRNGKILHIASEYLRHYDDIPEPLIKYIEKDPLSFREVIREKNIDQIKLLTGTVKQKLIHLINLTKNNSNVVSIIEAFPEEQKYEFINTAKQVIEVLVEKGEINKATSFIEVFPDEQKHQFTKLAISTYLDNNHKDQVEVLCQRISLSKEEETRIMREFSVHDIKVNAV